MALLVPLSISFNVLFWTFMMWILDQATYMMGAYTGICEGFTDNGGKRRRKSVVLAPVRIRVEDSR
jgi:hypothetical protein